MFPAQITDYEFIQELGGGPLTHVFAGRRLSDDRLCTIKLPRSNWSEHATAIRLLRREARVLHALRHAHLVRVLESHVTQPPYFVVVEFLEGETLRERMQRQFAMSIRSTCWAGRQLAEAIHAIHQAGFVHGDIRPENIMVHESGHATLIDLGSAHRPGLDSPIEDGEFLLASHDYRAPEMAGETPHDDFASDWYSFGLVLWEMLTGRLPDAKEGPDSAVETMAIMPRMMTPWPPRLTALLQALLSPRPSIRPRGALILHELIALEIATLGVRRAG